MHLADGRRASRVGVLGSHNGKRLERRGHQLDIEFVRWAIEDLERARAIAHAHLVPRVDRLASRIDANGALEWPIVIATHKRRLGATRAVGQKLALH
eukprot:scaffold191276_cov31-Tisochrysis_lutea.AAC.5